MNTTLTPSGLLTVHPKELLTCKEAAHYASAIVAECGPEQDITPYSYREISGAIRRGELTYLLGTTQLDADKVLQWALEQAREEWEQGAYATICEPHDFPSMEAYHAACHSLRPLLKKTGLFTDERIDQMTTPMKRII